MKKEDLIKKAAERGITLDEAQAEKYISLSDEELENLAVAGGGICDKDPEPQSMADCVGTKPSGKRYIKEPWKAKDFCGHYSMSRSRSAGVSYCEQCENSYTGDKLFCMGLDNGVF
ncbi:MAG: hypothetical protein LBL80_05085 [Ruminococcus sp.]|jgi:hypothetical protein|nr:hypothetical protein [Ruminococcus sp.]